MIEPIKKTARKFYGYLKKDMALLVKRRKYLYMTILLPFLVAILFLMMLAPANTKIQIGVCDFDGTGYTNSALQELSANFEANILADENCVENLTDMIKQRRYSLGLVVDKGFSQNLEDLKQARLTVYYDNTDVAFANLISWKVDASLYPFEQQILDAFNTEIKGKVKDVRTSVDVALELANQLPAVKNRIQKVDTDLKKLEEMNTAFLVNPIYTDQKPVFEQSTKSAGIAFIFPIISIFLLLMLASTSIIYDKNNHFITRVRASTTPALYLLAKLLFFIILSLLQFIIIFLLFLAYGASYPTASFLQILNLVLYVGMINASLGLIIGLISENEGIALLFSLMIAFPMMLLSGIFTPVQTMPGFVQWIVKILPLNYQINSVKSVLLFGGSMGASWMIVAAALFFVVYILLQKK